MANLLCLAFDDIAHQRGSRSHLGRCSTLVTGTPVRAAFRVVRENIMQRPRWLLPAEAAGARLLNESVPVAARETRVANRGLGNRSSDGVRRSSGYRRDLSGGRAIGRGALYPFCDDLAAVLVGAEVAICRAGGSTLAELAALRVPSVLLPLATALDDHQRHNARAFAAAGAAVVVDDATESVVLAKHLAIALAPLLENSARRRAMQQALAVVAQPDAALQISGLIQSLTSGVRIATNEFAPFPPASPGSIDAFAA